jgi:A/G-specific adenine glycosylase
VTIDAAVHRRIRRALLAWYRLNARDLPWRRTRDPYATWVSEIMLQQTRVEMVIPFYVRFLREIPDVRRLAATPSDRVLKLWEGLGYYGRARNLHRAAQQIVKRRGGKLPTTAEEWRELPGVGRYTAGAIASIAAGERVAALDGNIKRVLARLFGVELPIDTAAGASRLWRLAEVLLPVRRAGDFNQALMDLGAAICTPAAPRCSACPLQRFCAAAADGLQAELPIRGNRPAIRTVQAVAALIERRGRVLLVKRADAGLLGGLWELPGVECGNGRSAAALLRSIMRRRLGLSVAVGPTTARVKHQFTHRRLELQIARCSARGPVTLRGAWVDFIWTRPDALDELALSSLQRKALAAALA